MRGKQQIHENQLSRGARPAIRTTVTPTPPRSRTPTATSPLSPTTTATARPGTSFRTTQGRRIRSNSTTTTIRRAACPRTRSDTSAQRPRRATRTSSRSIGWGGSNRRRWWIRQAAPVGLKLGESARLFRVQYQDKRPSMRLN